MAYTDDFMALLGKQADVKDVKVFMFQNKYSCDLKRMPNEVGIELVVAYFNYLKAVSKGKSVIEFVTNEIRDDVIQTIETKYLGVWEKVVKARRKCNVENTQLVLADRYKNLGNVVMMEVRFERDAEGKTETVYFLSVYRNVAEWYRNSIRFVDIFDFSEVTKNKKITEKGELVKIDGDILAFSPNVDAVIRGDRCYIIDETNFSRIFKFDQVATNIVQGNASQIKGLEFIYNHKDLLELILKSTRLKREIARAVLSGRIKSISDCDPVEVHKRIEAREELKEIVKFEGHKIIVNEKNCRTVVGILSDRIHLDLLTNSVKGIEEYEP